MDRLLLIPWWRTRQARLLWLFGGAALLLLVVGVLLHTAADGTLRASRSDVTISKVRAGVFHDFVPLHGTVEPKDTVYLDALAGGQVAGVLVQAGDEVTKGQPLIVFRNEELELNVLDKAGRLVESMTQVRAYATQLENNRANNEKALADVRYNIIALGRTVSRYDELAKRGFVTRKAVEEAHDQFGHYRRLKTVQEVTNSRQEGLRLTELPGLQSQLASLQKSLEATQAQLQQLTVRAPLSGRITQLDLKIGEIKNRGQRLAEIVPHTGFKIRADVDQYYVGRVRVGQRANIILNGSTYQLLVNRIYPEVKNGTFSVDLAFNSAMPNDLSPGTTAEGKLSVGSDSSGIILPASAFLDESGGDYVFVVDERGIHAERRRIKLGRRNQDDVVVQSGLRPGERVITSGYSTFGNAQRIKLRD